MQHSLHYLGTHKTLAGVEEEYHRQRGSSDTYYAFGWTHTTYRDGQDPTRVMVAWLPSTAPYLYMVWPVYVGDVAPDLGGIPSWHWDGQVVRPTLDPSIGIDVRRPRAYRGRIGPPKRLVRGSVEQGQWVQQN